MNNEMPILVFGTFIGAFHALVFSWGVILGSEEEECEKANNVYDCIRIYVPTENQADD